MPQRASPNKGTPWLENNLIHIMQGDTEQAIPIGSSEWTAWLENATQFYVKNTQHGNFSCRKETRQRGQGYWYAYRRANGRTQNTYIGKDSDLTPQRLNETAQRLNEIIHGTAAPDAPQRKRRIDPPIVQNADIDAGKLWFHLTDGRVLGAPLEWFPSLVNATPEQRQHWEIIGAGTGVHWPDVDEHISVRVLMNLPS